MPPGIRPSLRGVRIKARGIGPKEEICRQIGSEKMKGQMSLLKGAALLFQV
jgi:hypothetical protein